MGRAGLYAFPGRGGEAKGAPAVVLPKDAVLCPPRPLSGRSWQPARPRVCVGNWEPCATAPCGGCSPRSLSLVMPLVGGHSPCFPRRGPSNHILHLSGVPQGCWKGWSSAVPSARRPPQGGWTIVGGLCAYTFVCLLCVVSSFCYLLLFPNCYVLGQFCALFPKFRVVARLLL